MMKKLLLLPLLAALLALPSAVRAQDACAVTQFPWSESFDTWDPTCWQQVGGSFATYSSYNHSGTGPSLKCPGPAAFMLVLPRMDAPLSELTFSVWLYKEGDWLSGQLEVGYCTDSSSLSSFVPVGTITQTAGSVWTQFTVSFAGVAEGAAGRIALRKSYTTNSGLYLDDMSVNRLSPCGDPEGLRVGVVGQHAAGLAWDNSLGADNSYVVAYRTVPGTQWDSVSVSTPYAFLTNLLADTTYEARVRSVCDGEQAAFCQPVEFNTQGCGKLTLGTLDLINNSARTEDYPFNGNYNHTYSQSVYPASLLSSITDSIRSMAYYNFMAYNDVVENRTVTVSLGLTDRLSFSDGALVADADLVEVYSGTWALTSGWNAITLDTPFAYDGESNLVLSIRDHTGAHAQNYVGNPVSVTDNLGTGSIHYFNDNEASLMSQGYTSERVPVVRFFYQCDPTVTCEAPLAMVVGGDPNSVDLVIQGGPGQQAWDIALRESGLTQWDDMGTAYDPEATIGGMEVGTAYQLRITPDCSPDGVRYSSILQFRTECGDISLPYFAGFDNLPEDSREVPCWQVGMGTGSAWPTVNYASTERSKMLSMPRGTYVALPPVSTYYTMPSLNLRLQARGLEGEASQLSVGVMSDPADLATFISLATINLGATAAYHEVSFAALDTMDGFDEAEYRYVAVRAASGNHMFDPIAIDNLLLRVTPACATPTGATLVSTTTTTATFAITGESNSYLLEYGPIGLPMGSGTFVAANDTTGLITGLQAGTRYDVYVYGVCADTSFAYGPVSFITDCGTIALPYSNNFDNELIPNMAHTATMPLCWNLVDGTAEIYCDRNLYEGVTFSGRNSLRLASGAIVALPQLGGNTASEVQVDLEAMSESTTARLVIGVCDGLTPGSFVGLDTVAVSDYTFAHVTSYLVHYQGTGLYVALRAQGEVYVDNVALTLAPTCFPLRNLRSTGNTATTVSLAWNEIAFATQWEVATTSSATTHPTSGTLVSSTSHTLTGLNPGELFYVWVRSYCSATDQGEWAGPLAVAANSWTMRANQTDTLTLCNAMIFDNGGANGNYTGNQTSIIVLRPDPAEGHAELHITGHGRVDGNSWPNYDYLRIYDGYDTTSGMRTATDGSVSFNIDYTCHTGVATIVFSADEWREYEGFELHVECLPVSCPMVSNLTAYATETTITASWTPQGSESQWVVDCGDFRQVVTTPTATFTDLYPSSNYEVSVRPLCGVGDTGVALSTLVSTDCGVILLTSNHPLFESFETAACPANDCWTLLYNGSDNRPTHSTAQALHGQRSFVFSSYYQVNNYNQYLITPQFFSGEAIQAAFAYRNHEEYVETLVVGYSTSSANPNDSSWVWIDTIYNTNNTSWSIYTATLPATAAYFGIHYANTSDNYYVYIDSLTLTTTFSGCVAPTLLDPEVLSYDQVRLSWTGFGAEFQFQYKELASNTWNIPAQTLQANEVTLSSLLAGTAYQYRVRMVCPEGEFSSWAMGQFVTDSLDCFAPSNLRATNISGTTATLEWSTGADEEEWVVRYFARGDTTTLTVPGEAACRLTNLEGSVTYTAMVRSRCGNGAAFSDWSDPITFTTLTCDTATAIAATATSAHTATVTWQGSAPSWSLYYGQTNAFIVDALDHVEVEGNSCQLTGLQAETDYYIFLVAHCDEGWNSLVTTPVRVTTLAGINDAVPSSVALFPNPATDRVTIEGYEGEIQIVDMTGCVVKTQTVSLHASLVNLSDLSAGAYFVKMGSMVKKLIVK